MNIRTVIVDDEEGARESLSNILAGCFPDVEVVAKAGTIQSAAEIIELHKPHLVFLDIQMPGGDAFELLAKFSKPDFGIIFITAYDRYAIKAIKYSAFDYLLKPVDIDELRHAIMRFKASRENPSSADRLKTLLDNFNHSGKLKKLAIPNTEGIQFVELNEIIRLESEGNYTRIYFADGKKILSSKTLGEYDDLLEEENFVRIHRSHSINLSHVRKYIRGEGGYVIMSDKTEVEVARRKKEEFMDKISKVVSSHLLDK